MHVHTYTHLVSAVKEIYEVLWYSFDSKTFFR